MLDITECGIGSVGSGMNLIQKCYNVQQSHFFWLFELRFKETSFAAQMIFNCYI